MRSLRLFLIILLFASCRYSKFEMEGMQPDNLELAVMVARDQRTRQSNSNITLEEMDQVHRARVFELIARDSIKTNKDRLNAALILQHTAIEYCFNELKSISVENYLMAYYLSKAAFDNGETKAAQFVATTFDRYLLFTKGYQKYGTQRIFDDKSGEELWAPIDENTTDAERAKYNIPPLDSLRLQYKIKQLTKK